LKIRFGNPLQHLWEHPDALVANLDYYRWLDRFVTELDG
jgi:hypothetical protein